VTSRPSGCPGSASCGCTRASWLCGSGSCSGSSRQSTNRDTAALGGRWAEGYATRPSPYRLFLKTFNNPDSGSATTWIFRPAGRIWAMRSQLPMLPYLHRSDTGIAAPAALGKLMPSCWGSLGRLCDCGDEACRTCRRVRLPRNWL